MRVSSPVTFTPRAPLPNTYSLRATQAYFATSGAARGGSGTRRALQLGSAPVLQSPGLHEHLNEPGAYDNQDGAGCSHWVNGRDPKST
jgi:hypothetical protein